MKRDDLTGLAFGGNKARKLEFLVGDALFFFLGSLPFLFSKLLLLLFCGLPFFVG